jgi:hypothetical protein
MLINVFGKNFVPVGRRVCVMLACQRSSRGIIALMILCIILLRTSSYRLWKTIYFYHISLRLAGKQAIDYWQTKKKKKA